MNKITGKLEGKAFGVRVATNPPRYYDGSQMVTEAGQMKLWRNLAYTKGVITNIFNANKHLTEKQLDSFEIVEIELTEVRSITRKNVQ